MSSGAPASKTAIIFTGGINHPFDDAAPVLAAILADAGFEVSVTTDLDEVLSTLRADQTALLVNYALRWSMTQDEKYAPDREAWALRVPQSARDAITGHVSGGGGLLGIHTASICFDDWSQWRDVLGGAWQWGRSWHPAPGPAQVKLEVMHELVRGLADFAIRDEVYSDLDLTPQIDVAAWARAEVAAGGRETGTQPALWTHRYGRGRVVYDALGHDSQSLEHPVHRRILQRSALWASGREERLSCAM